MRCLDLKVGDCSPMSWPYLCICSRMMHLCSIVYNEPFSSQEAPRLGVVPLRQRRLNLPVRPGYNTLSKNFRQEMIQLHPTLEIYNGRAFIWTTSLLERVKK